MWNGTSTLPSSLQGGNLRAGYYLAYDQDNRLTGWSSYADAFKTTFAYDTRDQVTGATHTAITGLTPPRPLPATESYAFDGAGNRNLSGGGSSSADGTFNRVQNDGTYTYDYDAEGNQIRRTKISDGKVTEYEWDYRNRLVKVTEKVSLAGAATKIVTFQYDAFDRRTGKLLDSDANGSIDRKTAWVWDGQQVIMQLVDADGAGTAPWKLTNRYLYGEAVDLVLADEQLPNGGIGLTSVSYTTGNVLWPLFDQLGSVRDVMDSNGVIRQHLVFDSFGNRLSETDYNSSGVVIPSSDPAAVDELFGYTGREWDKDVGLQYNRARWYDPAQGRWLSQDPIGFSAGDVNWYRYVGNEATRAVDPTGLKKTVAPANPLEYESFAEWRQADLPFRDKLIFDSIALVNYRGPSDLELYKMFAERDRWAAAYFYARKEQARRISQLRDIADAPSDPTPVFGICGSTGVGALAGGMQVGRALTYPARWVGVDFSRQDAALERIWQMAHVSKETQDRTEVIANGAATVAYLAAGTAAWTYYIGEFGVAFSTSPASPVGIHVAFGYGRAGQLVYAHGLGEGLFVTTEGATAAGFLTIEGIPILAPSAIAAWVAGKPEVGDCGKAAIEAFKKGWKW